LLTCPAKKVLKENMDNKKVDRNNEKMTCFCLPFFLVTALGSGLSASHCKSIFCLVKKYLGRNSQAVTNAVLAISQTTAAFGTQAWSKCCEAEDGFSVSVLTALSQNWCPASGIAV